MTGWAIERLRPMITAGRIARWWWSWAPDPGRSPRPSPPSSPAPRCHAVELSEEAAAYARRNLADTDVELHVGDMADALPELNGTVDLVIANPPYIPLEAYASVAPEVRDHDPTRGAVLRGRRAGRDPGS